VGATMLTLIPSLGNQSPEDQKFKQKHILGYIVGLPDSAFQKKKKKKKSKAINIDGFSPNPPY